MLFYGKSIDELQPDVPSIICDAQIHRALPISLSPAF